MRSTPVRSTLVAACITAASAAAPADAQSAKRDAIADLLNGGTISIRVRALDGSRVADATPAGPGVKVEQSAEAAKAAAADPRDGDPGYEQAKRLMTAVDTILKDTAETRSGVTKLPSRDDFIMPPMWRETREDRNTKVRDLLDAALGIVTDVPVVDVQKKVETLRRNIRELEDQNAKLKEKQLLAPKDATLPGILNDTVASLDAAIVENNKRIDVNRAEIAGAKSEITSALKTQGVELQTEQVDLQIR